MFDIVDIIDDDELEEVGATRSAWANLPPLLLLLLLLLLFIYYYYYTVAARKPNNVKAEQQRQ